MRSREVQAIVADLAGKNKLEVGIVVEQTVLCGCSVALDFLGIKYGCI
jgi:hypothetical protein